MSLSNNDNDNPPNTTNPGMTPLPSHTPLTPVTHQAAAEAQPVAKSDSTPSLTDMTANISDTSAKDINMLTTMTDMEAKTADKSAYLDQLTEAIKKGPAQKASETDTSKSQVAEVER